MTSVLKGVQIHGHLRWSHRHRLSSRRWTGAYALARRVVLPVIACARSGWFNRVLSPFSRRLTLVELFVGGYRYCPLGGRGTLLGVYLLPYGGESEGLLRSFRYLI